MNNCIDRIILRDDMTLLTVSGFPANTSDMAQFFAEISSKKVNLDMISQTAPYGGVISISITFSDEQLPEILTVISSLKGLYPNIRTDISSANRKLLFYGEAMRDTPGVTAYIFSVLNKIGCEIKMITTSDIEVSLLTESHSGDDMIKRLEDITGISVTK
ncbi:MAG: hypothetical protein Q8865_05975 [Bacillota bacterium]|nr:hypothetical protein [Bacillota bacterium]